MKRITKKRKDGFYKLAPNNEIYGEENGIRLVQIVGHYEDIEEERLSKYKEIGINGLIDLFENLTDEDIEYIIQLAFKKRKIIYDIR